MDFIDYYKTLGLTKNASAAEIKASYRKLARQYHPDINPNNAEANLSFQQINEANSVLSDTGKRKQYDQYGENWERGADFEMASRNHTSQQRRQRRSSSAGDFSDFFESMFGGDKSASGSAIFRGKDLRASLQLSFLDAYKTHQQILSVNGKSIRITIPAGVENGQTIKIRNHGGFGINGGPKGDLYLTFFIDTHPDFKRLGNDLHITKELGLYTAILGGELMLDTLYGKLKLKVKPETQNGERVKLKGKGFPIYKKEGVFGDLYVTYQIKIPTGLTTKQKELFSDLSKT